MNTFSSTISSEVKGSQSSVQKPDMFNTWAKTHLKLDVYSSISLVKLHNNYKNFVLNQGFIPMKKLVFSSNLKQYFATQIYRGEIYINSTSKLIFDGISLCENPNLDNINLQ